MQDAASRHSTPADTFNPLSPTSPKGRTQHASMNAINSKVNGWKDSIRSVLIQDVQQKDDSSWVFTIELKFNNSSTNILKRTWDDFWILHIGLLNHFPKESGRTGRGRLVPFLTKTACKTQEDAIKAKNVLDTYLQELINLPSDLVNSSQAKRFFLVTTTNAR
jgi:hypothetical protein